MQKKFLTALLITTCLWQGLGESALRAGQISNADLDTAGGKVTLKCTARVNGQSKPFYELSSQTETLRQSLTEMSNQSWININGSVLRPINGGPLDMTCELIWNGKRLLANLRGSITSGTIDMTVVRTWLRELV
jgi:hypothetical protein